MRFMNRFLFPMMAIATCALFASCASVKPVPYGFNAEAQETATISFESGNPGVQLVSYENSPLPAAEKNTCWDPIAFPAGKELGLTVHTFYEQQAATSNGLFVALITSAIASGCGIDKDVAITCPALDSGKKYLMKFAKSAGVNKNGQLTLTDTANQKIVYSFDVIEN